MASEIKRVIETSGGTFGYGDFAILRECCRLLLASWLFDVCCLPVRDNYVSPELKSAMNKADIPFRILPELSRFDVPEIKTLLAYLRLALNPAYTPLLCRALEGPEEINTKVSEMLQLWHGPSNMLSFQAIVQLIERGVDAKVIVFNILEQLASAAVPDTKPSIKEKAQKFVRLVKNVRKLVDQVSSILSICDY
jgi:superfamily I DNA/RNA helicase